MNLPRRPVRPDDLALIGQIPEVGGMARDEDTRMFWCSPLFVQWASRVVRREDMLGKTVFDGLAVEAARERAAIYREVIESGVGRSHYQLSAGRRVMCTILPLDEEAFGHRGILAIVKESPHRLQGVGGVGGVGCDFPVVATPSLDRFEALSIRELEVLHRVAGGCSTQEVADSISRARKTVEHHLNSIHTKLGTGSRGELVRFASERGIQSFTEEEWGLIVSGVRAMRRETAAGRGG